MDEDKLRVLAADKVEVDEFTGNREVTRAHLSPEEVEHLEWELKTGGATVLPGGLRDFPGRNCVVKTWDGDYYHALCVRAKTGE